MTERATALPLLLAFALACSGCASGRNAPSLAPRAVEQLSFEEPERRMPDIPSDGALPRHLDALLAQARAGQEAFAREAPGATRAAQRTGAPGSEAWVTAQQALSRLEAARQGTVAALAEMDALATARANQPTSAADRARISEVFEAISTLTASQQRIIDDLTARLRG